MSRQILDTTNIKIEKDNLILLINYICIYGVNFWLTFKISNMYFLFTPKQPQPFSKYISKKRLQTMYVVHLKTLLSLRLILNHIKFTNKQKKIINT